MLSGAFRPFAYSHARAGGLWQFKPGTAEHFGVRMNWWYDGRRDVVAGTEAALDYFGHLHAFFDGDWLLAIAAYNAGEGTVRQAVRANERRGEPTDFWHLDLPQQTERYVPRVLGLKQIVETPWAHDLALPTLDSDKALALVELEGQIDLARAADWAGVPIETLYRYNPGLNRWATPPAGPHRLAVPAEAASRLRAALAKHDTSQLVQWRRHKVRPGDTLNEIANAYDTTVDAVRKANGLDGDVIRVGQHLVVPTASRTQQAYVLSQTNRRRAEQADGPAGHERVNYRVERGDSLWEVARAYDVPVRRLAEWNGMAPGDPIQPGDRLVVWLEQSRAARGGPDERIQRVDYTVQRGDSLTRIADRFNVEVTDLRRWNDLSDSVLQPGQQLRIRVDVTAQAGTS
jgi:membrane-bound lytic murein transglycosylase D